MTRAHRPHPTKLPGTSVPAITLLAVAAGLLWAAPATRAQTDRRTVMLPRPQTSGPMSLEEALAERRSRRDFSKTTLVMDHVGQLCWAAQGITDPSRGFRTAPSAGALFPLELYVALPEGLYRYLPRRHALEKVKGADLRRAIWAAGLQQDPLLRAAAVFVITGVPARTASKYGGRAVRYVWVEAGHAGQNLLLQAEALGLAGVGIGAFDDARLSQALGLRAGEEPLYLLPVGERR